MNHLIITNISIRQDEQGRFCLNDLHRAAGSENRHKPSLWMNNKQTQELIDAISIAGIPAIESKQGLGTFVCKELVYAYGMWINPEFHLKVIRAYDAMQTQGQYQIPQSLPEALRLAADLAEENKKLEQKVEEDAPKIEIYERLCDAQGSVCIRDGAKALQLPPEKLKNWLICNSWIFRRAGNKNLLGYQTKVQAGYLIHKVSTYTDQNTGEEKVSEQVRITPKGLAKLASIFQKEQERLL